MPEVIRFRAHPRPWLLGVLSVVFAVVGFVALPVGAVGWLVGIFAHADLVGEDESEGWLWVVVTMAGALLGLASFFVGLAGVIRGPQRLLPAIGMALSFLPVLALVVLWAIVYSATMSPA